MAQGPLTQRPLPRAPVRYEERNESETRRELEEMVRQIMARLQDHEDRIVALEP